MPPNKAVKILRAPKLSVRSLQNPFPFLTRQCQQTQANPLPRDRPGKWPGDRVCQEFIRQTVTKYSD